MYKIVDLLSMQSQDSGGGYNSNAVGLRDAFVAFVKKKAAKSASTNFLSVQRNLRISTKDN